VDLSGSEYSFSGTDADEEEEGDSGEDEDEDEEGVQDDAQAPPVAPAPAPPPPRPQDPGVWYVSDDAKVPAVAPTPAPPPGPPDDPGAWFEPHLPVRHKLDIFDWAQNPCRSRIHSIATQVYCRQRTTMAAAVVALRAVGSRALGRRALTREAEAYLPRNRQHFAAFLKECVPRTRLSCVIFEDTRGIFEGFAPQNPSPASSTSPTGRSATRRCGTTPSRPSCRACCARPCSPSGSSPSTCSATRTGTSTCRTTCKRVRAQSLSSSKKGATSLLRREAL